MSDANSRGKLTNVSIRDGQQDEVWVEIDVALGAGDRRRWSVALRVAAAKGELVIAEMNLRSDSDDAGPLGGVTVDDLRRLPFSEIWEAAMNELRALASTPQGTARLAIAGITDIPPAGKARAGRPRRTRAQTALELDQMLGDPHAALRSHRRDVIARARRDGVGDRSGFTTDGRTIIASIRELERIILTKLLTHHVMSAAQVATELEDRFDFDVINAAVEALESDHAVRVSWTKGTDGIKFRRLEVRDAHPD
jgi:hypothetical protein